MPVPLTSSFNTFLFDRSNRATLRGSPATAPISEMRAEDGDGMNARAGNRAKSSGNLLTT